MKARSPQPLVTRSGKAQREAHAPTVCARTAKGRRRRPHVPGGPSNTPAHGVPHSPQRGPNTVGLVIERVRPSTMMDSFAWYCENCSHKLYEEFLPVADIVSQLPPVMNAFYADEAKRTCEKCGTVMEPPQKLA